MIPAGAVFAIIFCIIRIRPFFGFSASDLFRRIRQQIELQAGKLQVVLEDDQKIVNRCKWSVSAIKSKMNACSLLALSFILLGKFEGCISATKEQGRSVTDETLGYYKQLKDFTDKAA